MNFQKIGIIFVGVFFVILSISEVAVAKEAKDEKIYITPAAKLKSIKLIEALKKGGYIIYFRHHISEHMEIDKSRTNLKDCSTQRNLSSEGKKGSKEIGKAIRALKLNISSVISSPYCRCRDTAKLAFGKATLDDDLQFAIYDGPQERKRKGEALRKLLSQKPKANTNAVIVSHTANLKEAAKIWPKPEGVAIVFEPYGNRKFSYVGIVLPNEWRQFAKDK